MEGRALEKSWLAPSGARLQADRSASCAQGCTPASWRREARAAAGRQQLRPLLRGPPRFHQGLACRGCEKQGAAAAEGVTGERGEEERGALVFHL